MLIELWRRRTSVRKTRTRRDIITFEDDDAEEKGEVVTLSKAEVLVCLQIDMKRNTSTQNVSYPFVRQMPAFGHGTKKKKEEEERE